MITDVNVQIVEDVNSPNEVFHFEAPFALSALLFSSESHGKVLHARNKCLKRALEIISKHFPQWQPWLVVKHRSKQPDNNIARSRRLWKSIEGMYLLPEGERVELGIERSADGLRFFGALQFEPAQIDRVGSVMLIEDAAVVLLQHSSAIMEVGQVTIGQSLPGGIAANLIGPVCSKFGICLQVFGEFDDPSVEVVAVGNRGWIPDDIATGVDV